MSMHDDYELDKADHKAAFEILRQTGRWSPSQIRKLIKEPKGLRDEFAAAYMTGAASRGITDFRGAAVDAYVAAVDAYVAADCMLVRRSE